MIIESDSHGVTDLLYIRDYKLNMYELWEESEYLFIYGLWYGWDSFCNSILKRNS